MISTYFFNQTIAQAVGPIIVNVLAKQCGAYSDVSLLGTIIFWTTTGAHLLSVPMWVIAGLNYVRMMKEKEEDLLLLYGERF